MIARLGHLARLARAGFVFAREGVFGVIDPVDLPVQARLPVSIARLAERHGITDWEANLATYVAIGEDLGLAKVNEAELMAYQRGLGGDDLSKREAIRRGYDARR